MAEFEIEKIHKFTKLGLSILKFMGFLHYHEFEKDGTKWAEINNLTILNLILKFTGPIYEYELNNVFLGLQIFCSFLAFFFRFYFAFLLYEIVH